MSLLLLAPVCAPLPVPEFGGAFAARMAEKRHPELRRASLTAWNLLAYGLSLMGAERLPEVDFTPRGKPFFPDSPLHFSLTHSGALAAALLSGAPCGVDLERVRPEVAQRMRARCLNEREQAEAPDFFACWTKKECIAKLDGSGMRVHPDALDTLDPRYAHRFFCERVRDTDGREYVLSALCDGAEALRPLPVSPGVLVRNQRP